MPFAALPSSPGFVPPQAPSWQPFALEAIHELERRPIVDTAGLVQRAVDQINNILQLSSPAAKAQRQLQLLQLQTMQQVWQDYRDHPENYRMSANGPIAINPLDRYLKYSQVKRNIAQTDLLNKKSNMGVPSVVANYKNDIQGLHQGGASISQVGTPTEGTPIAGTDSTTQESPEAQEQSALENDNTPTESGETETPP